MVISPRLLRYLDEVARSGTIRRAAERLNVAASSINRQIIALEEDLGTPLFDRAPRRMRPTAAGEVLIAYARDAIAAQRRALDQVDTLRGSQSSRCAIATVGGLARDVLASTVAGLRAERPQSRFALRVMTAEGVARAVASDDAELGFAFDLPALPRLATAFAADSPCEAVVHPRHPLAGRRSVQLAEIAAFPLCLPQHGALIRDQLDARAARLGLWLDPVIESDNFDLLKRFTGTDSAVAVLNRVDVHDSLACGDLSFLPILELEGFTQRLSIVHSDRRPLSPFAALVVERLRARIGDG